MKISVSIIGYNEAPNLERCLKSVVWADEIVYVDCGSSDNSLGIAAAFKARTFLRRNDLNINVNKQFGLDQCSGDWILYLDPDEEVPEALARELRVLAEKGGCAAYDIPRKNFYFGRWLRNGGKYPDRQRRFFKRGAAAFPCRNIHEKLSVSGLVGRSENAFLHNVCGGADELIAKMGSYALRKSEEYRRSGSFPGLLKPSRRFVLNYFVKAGFMDGREGLTVAVVDFLNECLAWLKYREKPAA